MGKFFSKLYPHHNDTTYFDNTQQHDTTYFDNTQQHDKRNGLSLWNTLVHRRNNIIWETGATTIKAQQFPSKRQFLSLIMTISNVVLINEFLLSLPLSKEIASQQKSLLILRMVWRKLLFPNNTPKHRYDIKILANLRRSKHFKKTLYLKGFNLLAF
jgi:hypothetical protein